MTKCFANIYRWCHIKNTDVNCMQVSQQPKTRISRRKRDSRTKVEKEWRQATVTTAIAKSTHRAELSPFINHPALYGLTNAECEMVPRQVVVTRRASGYKRRRLRLSGTCCWIHKRARKPRPQRPQNSQ